MNLIVAVYSAILFFVLTPNVFLRLPSNGSKIVVAAVHAAIFGAVLYLTQKYVWKKSVGIEGLPPANAEDAKTRAEAIRKMNKTLPSKAPASFFKDGNKK